MRFGKLLAWADLAGVFLFALEGAAAGVRANLDLLGLFVVAFATALGGGMVRDALIGATPVAALKDWRYPVTAFAGGVVVFLGPGITGSVTTIQMVTLDAAGLSLFAIAGAMKALDFGVPSFNAVLLGGLTGVGGGTIRDVLLARVPTVLNAHIYAAAALLGAAIFAVGVRCKAPANLAAVIGGIACFALRMAAYRYDWNLPHAL